MTRKDYELLARIMKRQRPQTGDDIPMSMGEEGQAQARYGQWIKDCRALADALKQDNPRFDVGMFLRNCGVNKCACGDTGFVKIVSGGVAGCSATDIERIPCPGCT